MKAAALPRLRRRVPWFDVLTFPLWGTLDAAAWLLGVTVNRSWRGPSVLAGANDDPEAKRETERAGAFQCVYYDE